MIKTIIFDCYGVLTTDRWRLFIDSLPPGPEVEKARDAHHQYDAGLITEAECVQRIFEHTGKRFSETPKATDDVTKNQPLFDYIRELKQTYKIGMISNVADNWIRDTFLTEDEQKLFDAMIFSYEFGITKPDLDIYKIALKRLGANAQESVFIDDIERFARAATKLGMKGIVYQNFHQLKRELESLLTDPNH